MARIEVYTKFLCPYCTRAKALLDSKGAAFEEIDVTMDRAGFDAMVARTRSRPLPSGQVSLRGAQLWLAAQTAVGALMLLTALLVTVKVRIK